MMRKRYMKWCENEEGEGRERKETERVGGKQQNMDKEENDEEGI